MKSVKLGACLVAASVTLGGAAFLAQPVQASELMAECSTADRAYAEGYADGYCEGKGYKSGSVTSCTDNGDGTITISGSCSNA